MAASFSRPFARSSRATRTHYKLSPNDAVVSGETLVYMIELREFVGGFYQVSGIQRTVLILAVVLVVATGLYVPWTEQIGLGGKHWTESRYRWLFDPPEPRIGELMSSEWTASVDLARLLVEWGIIVLSSLGLAWAFRTGRR
jgi:hypothetical protein